GSPRTWIVVTAFVFESIRETVSSSGWESHTAPPPAATSSPGGTLTRATTAFRIGSIRISVDVGLLIAQAAPSPTANPPPSGGTRMLAITLPPAGSGITFGVASSRATGAGGASVDLELTRVSVVDAKLLTHTESPAAVTRS